MSPDRIIDKAVIVEGETGQFHVRAESSNGEAVLTSETYTDLDWTRKVASDLGVPVIEKLRG